MIDVRSLVEVLGISRQWVPTVFQCVCSTEVATSESEEANARGQHIEDDINIKFGERREKRLLLIKIQNCANQFGRPQRAKNRTAVIDLPLNVLSY